LISSKVMTRICGMTELLSETMTAHTKLAGQSKGVVDLDLPGLALSFAYFRFVPVLALRSDGTHIWHVNNSKFVAKTIC
jgi:hypothetical protein